MSAAPSPSQATPQAKPAKTALHHVLGGPDYPEIQRFLARICAKRGVRGEAALDAIQEAFRVAFTHEHAGRCWDPKVEVAHLHLGRLLLNVLRGKRRSAKKDPSQLDDEHTEKLASDTPEPGAALMEHQEESQHASEVHKTLMAETRAGLTVRILDAMRAGIVGHENIAKELGVELEEVRAAFKRLRRRLKLADTQSNKGKPS